METAGRVLEDAPGCAAAKTPWEAGEGGGGPATRLVEGKPAGGEAEVEGIAAGELTRRRFLEELRRVDPRLPPCGSAGPAAARPFFDSSAS